MLNHAERLIPVGTPGDVAVLGPGDVAVADMTEGVVASAAAQTGQVQGRTPLHDVRSVVRLPGDQWFAVGAFSREARRSDAGSGVRMPERLPLWADSGVGGPWFADAANAEIVPFADPSAPVRTPARHLSSFAVGGDRFWVADRPAPVVWELAPDGTVLARHVMRDEPRAELTGICVSDSGAVLVLERHRRRIYRLAADGRFIPCAVLPRAYHRLRGLRRHSGGAHPYHVADPRTRTVLWLDERLRVSEAWIGHAASRSLLAGDWHRPDAARAVDGERWAVLHSPAGPTVTVPAALGPRDIRIAPDGDLYIVLRDAHRLEVLTPATGRRRSVGGPQILLYPCGLDIDPRTGEPHVLDPLRGRIVVFDRAGRPRHVRQTHHAYPRWLRFTRDGAAWVLDLAVSQFTRYEAGYRDPEPVALPPHVDAVNVEWVEPLADGALLVGGAAIGAMAFASGRWCPVPALGAGESYG